MIQHVASVHYRIVNFGPIDPANEESAISKHLLSLNSYRDIIKEFNEMGLKPPVLEAYGGATVSIVRNTDTNTYHIGITCCNTEEKYNKRLGITESLKRATKAAKTGHKFYKMPNLKQTYFAHDYLELLVQDVPLRYITDDKTLPIHCPY